MKGLRLLFVALPLLAAGLFLASCGKKSEVKDLDYLVVKLEDDEDWSIIDGNGEVVAREEYAADSKVSFVSDGVYWVQDADGYHLYHVDDPKNPLIEKTFSSATIFVDGRATVSNPDEPITLINTDGETVRQMGENVGSVYPFQNEYAVYFDRKANKFGYIDRSGDIVIPARYDLAISFNEDLAIVSKDQSAGILTIIDKKGNERGNIDGMKYTLQNLFFVDEMLAVCNNEDKKFEMLNSKGEKVLSLSGSVCQTTSETRKPYNIGGTIIFSDASGKMGIADYEGNRLIRPKYDWIFYFGNGTYAVEKKDKVSFVDKEDNSLDSDKYDNVFLYLLGGNVIAKEDDTYHLLDPDDKFHRVGRGFKQASKFTCDNFTKYVSVSAITESVLSIINTDNVLDIYPDFSSEEACKTVGMTNPSDFARANILGMDTKFQSMPDLKVESELHFSKDIAETLSHVERTGNGWWSYNRTVVDGYKFSDAIPVSCKTQVSGFDKDVPSEFLFKSLCNGLEKKGFTKTEVSDREVVYVAQVKGCSSSRSESNMAKLEVWHSNKEISFTYYYPAAASEGAYTRPQGVAPKANAPAGNEVEQPVTDDYAWLGERLATEADIKGKSKAEIRLMRNSIFARHGYKFKDKALTEHFSKFSWYKAERSDVTGLLNKVETQNIAFLKAHE